MNKKANSRMRLEGGGKGIALEGLDKYSSQEMSLCLLLSFI